MLGAGVVGNGAEHLIDEGVLAVEMGATAEDLARSMHAHPTLSETVGEAADLLLGIATHLPPPSGSRAGGAAGPDEASDEAKSASRGDS